MWYGTDEEQDVCGQVVQLLYRDCLVEQRDLFFQSLAANFDHPAKYATRLRFGYTQETYTDVYQWIMLGGDWEIISRTRSKPSDPDPPFEYEMRAHMNWATSLGMTRSGAIVKGPILPRLERIVLGSLHEPVGDYAMERLLTSVEEHQRGRRTLAFSLLSMTSSKHYCQAMQMGLLCLRHVVLVPTPPKVCTFHLPPVYPELGFNTNLPIVLGSINRYIFPKEVLITCTADGDVADDSLPEALLPLISLGMNNLLMTMPGVNGGPVVFDRLCHHKSDTMERTTFEVYGAVKCVIITAAESAIQSRFANRYHDFPQRQYDFAHRPRSSLEPVQKFLDIMSGHWKGRSS